MSRILTLNVGASKAVLAEYSTSGKTGLTLNAYGSGELPSLDVNDPGSIAASLPSVLRQILREQNIAPAPVIVSLSGQMVFPRFAKFPPMGDGDKLEQLVRYEIEQNVPFPIDEIVSDHQFVGTTAEGERAAMIVAAKLEGVRAVTDSVRAAGLKPAVIDVSPIAVCNALKYSYPQLDGCSVVLDIGAKTTNLIILEGEKIYNRSIPVAGNTITKDLAQKFGCTYEEAEQLKLERGYVSLGGVTEDADEVTDRVSKEIRTVLTRLHAEISRSINFYRSQQGGSAPTHLYLTGGTARLPQLAEFFTESLQIEVEFLNPFEKVGLGAKIDQTALENDAFTLTESVGLALRSTDGAWISLNLMPPELVNEARAVKRIPFLAAGGLAILAALAVACIAESRATEAVKAKIECVQQRTGKLKGDDAKLKTAQKSVVEEQVRCAEVQKLLWDRSVELRRVNDVRNSLLPGMWLASFKTEPAKDDKGTDKITVSVRGWRDALTKIENDWAKNHNNERSTVAEIVQKKLKRSSEFVPESVKLVGTKEDKMTMFTIEMNAAVCPSVAPVEKERKGGRGK